MITESEDLEQALQFAAIAWPSEKDHKSILIKRLIEEGARALEGRISQTSKARLEAIDAVAGKYDDVWPDDWLEQARSEWPD